MNQPPSFWWDFHWVRDNIRGILIESDDPAYPIIVEVQTPKEAEKVISDLKAGRIDYRRLSKSSR